MTVFTEMSRLKTAIADAYTACQEMGATMPAVLNSDNLEQCIASISGGKPVNQGRFVVASNAKIAYSDDGLTWTEIENTNALGYYLTFGNGKFFGAREQKLVFSNDGINWSTYTSTVSNLTHPSYFKNNFYAFGYNNNSFIKTSDGQSIENGTINISKIGGSATDGNVLVVSADNGIKYTTDGINWNTASSARSLEQVCYGNGLFITPQYSSNQYLYSTDGVTWTYGTLPSSSYWYTICYGNGLFVVVASDSNKFAYSSDGMNWTEGTLPATNKWSDIIYGNGIFVLVSQGMSDPWKTDQYLYSTDGITWTAGTLPSSQSWLSVAYGEVQ